MNTRSLSVKESCLLGHLNETGCESVLLFLTETGLSKGILDVTEPMRALFSKAGVHDFRIQKQGEDAKVMRDALLVASGGIFKTPISLYRPETKKGDPRMWIYGLGKFATANDVCAIFIRGGDIHVLNLSRSVDLSQLASKGVRKTPAIKDKEADPNLPEEVLHQLTKEYKSVALELLDSLKRIASAGPLKAVCKGDTAVGRSVESALNIRMNSKRDPDFQGLIEIKSFREPKLGRGHGRQQLFSCVPDWNISTCKSSTEIMQMFSTKSSSPKGLFCTTSARGANPRGLQLGMMEAESQLKEFHIKNPKGDVCIWPLPKLHERLLKKHKETFWIKVEASIRGDQEWFQLKSVMHTTQPSTIHFNRLVADGSITLDHSIERDAKNIGHEKGPLFRMYKPKLPELFLGMPKEYSLV